MLSLLKSRRGSTDKPFLVASAQVFAEIDNAQKDLKGSLFQTVRFVESKLLGGLRVISQIEFDKFVRDYNDDCILLLRRASVRQYDCLISAFMVLKDLYKVIQVMFDTGHYTYKVLPYPFSFRADEILLRQLGFDEQQMQNIFGFLDHVKTTQGMEFEACLEAGSAAMCARVR